MQGRSITVDEAALPPRDMAVLRRDYGIDTGFEADLAEVWTLVSPRIEGVVRGLLTRQGAAVSDDHVAKRVAYARGKLGEPVDQSWVDRILAEADRISEQSIEMSVLGASMLVGQMQIHALLFELSRDPARIERLTRATQKLAVIEFEVIVSRLHAINRARNQAALAASSANARAELREAITSTARASREVAGFTERTAAELAALRAPAAEVASAADQSATAMSRSAESAALLISAYERAHGEASAAAEVAGRADAIALEGADNADRLAAHTARIESVTTLIADIANQTKLLALNASIEAARAGESGRGFAVVAQEVRSLADQAAEATDGIAATIRAAQEAAEVMSGTNQKILSIVTDLLTRVQGVAAAMEEQVQTVSAILASIDETAVSSREIAALIATISDRVTTLAADAESAGRQAVAAGEALHQIEATAGQFMGVVAR